MKKVEKSIELGGRSLTLSTGKLAQQANAAVLATYGETVVLATVVSAPMKMPLDYFPLSVEYQERLYAGGRIKGSRWVKRDGRPSDEEILTGRLIDRSIRPLFPKNYKKEVQVIVTVMSVDLENTPDMAAATAVSAALAMSSIPWKGPVAPVKVGFVEGKYVVNPTEKELKQSSMELVVTSTVGAIVMIEDGSNEVTEEEILGGIAFGQKEGKKVIEFINEFAGEALVKKEELIKETKNQKLIDKVKKIATPEIKARISDMAKGEGMSVGLSEIKQAVIEELGEEEPAEVGVALETVFKEFVRKMILSGKRADGRKLDEIRPLSAEVGVLPRTHGSGLFQRGQTQVLTSATLGATSLGQLIETAEGEEEKRYMHHYIFPPFSTGETGKVGAPGRREIGHGALAERALLPVIPSESEFPYAIHLVSEVLSSNGSTSMGSTCGSTLALMDAGVPIKAPVGGIAMGVIVEPSSKGAELGYAILTDIAGLEDFNGDMDFKVAGTAKGITALQLDVKTLELSYEMLEKAIAQAKIARMQVLDVITSAIPQPRKSVSAHAPKVRTIKIPVDKIGELIGPGGKNIKKIMADTKANIDVVDDGTVTLMAVDQAAVDAAYIHIENMMKEVMAGEIYEGVVKRIQPFGAFIEILPGKEGMVHVSDMSENPEEFVSDPSEKVAEGDKVKVRVREVDQMGRINLSMRMDASTDKPRAPRGPREGGFGGDRRGGGFDRNRGGYDRDRRGGDRDRGGVRRDSGGPHFSPTRFVGGNDRRGNDRGGRGGGDRGGGRFGR